MPAPRPRLARLASITALVAVSSLLISCAPPDEPTADTVASSEDHLQTAMLISHVTDGTVPRDVRITVRFVDEHDDRETDADALADAFSCDPDAPGAAEWIDERTLALAPRQQLAPGRDYRCTLDVAAVLPNEASAKSFAFSFRVAPNQLLGWQADIEPLDDDPERLVASGHLEFSDAVTIADVREHVRLADGPERIKLEWRVEPGDHRFWFTSEPILRGSVARTLELEIPVEPFAIEAPASRRLEIRPLSDLGVVDVEVVNRDTEPRVDVTFSDPLAEDSDLSAYVRVEPHVDLRVSVAGKTLSITGAFGRERDYVLHVRHGVPSRWDTPMKEDFQRRIRFADLAPRISFSQSGALLPTSADGTIAFRTVNVREVTARVTRVFESNLGQFLQEGGLAAAADQRHLPVNLNRVGVEVAATELAIGDARNSWVQSTLDLSPLLAGHERGLYVLQLDFDREQVLIDCDPKQRYPYYDHPCGHGYFYRNGTVVRPLMVTDIGLLAKRTGSSTIVAATHLETARPLADVDVTLYSYQNQPLAQARTDGDGIALLDTADDGFYLEGRWRGQRTALRFTDTQLATTGFDVGGSLGGSAPTRAFLYTDRGVYRPGDTIHLSAIVRSRDGGLPDDHPVLLKVRNPMNQVVHSQLIRSGLAGHYAADIPTESSDPTGRWIADLYTGETRLASHPVHVEMIAPNRLKVRLDPPEVEPGGGADATIGLDASYLFGAPAAGLRGTVEVAARSVEKTFDAWSEFRFTHPARFVQPETEKIFDAPLDDGGHADVRWTPPTFAEAPSAIDLTITARVFEKGGRPTTEASRITVDPYDAYVGLRGPSANWVALDRQLPLSVIVVDPDGRPIPGRQLEVSVWSNERSWWWEYRSFDDYRRRFRSDVRTRLVETTTVTSGTQPVAVDVVPSTHGQLLIEVRDPAGGHAAGAFYWASSWGRSTGPLEAGTQLEMEVDRETYHPGDTARITVKTPSEGIAFISVEKGDEVLDHFWRLLDADTTELELPITDAMLPNVYLHVIAVQPHAQSANDRPLRLYGIVPVAVEEAATRLPISVRAPEKIKPFERFTVEVEAPSDRDATVTVAVVDEGLLDLTSFRTPDPWGFFFAKEGLGVATFDIFGSVIGAIWGEIDRRFEIGGDEDAYRKGQAGPVTARRFPPVALFVPPTRLGADGRAAFELEMPHYMGSVRIMAVAAAGRSFGSAELTVPVRDALIVQSSLPRVAGPGEHFDMPVTVFATEDGLGTVEVTATTTGPLAVAGDTATTFELDRVGEHDLVIPLAASTAAGIATVRVTARAGSASGLATTELAVRPTNPSISGSDEVEVRPGDEVSFTIPELGIPGTRRAHLRLSSLPGLAIGHRVESLIRYPYGCMEQTMSAVFPQLYLKPLLRAERADSPWSERRIDDNVDAGIDRLQRFRTPSGGFGYWPGATQVHEWATNYGGHYLLEAKRLGYHVPDDMLSDWLRFQRELAARESGDEATRCYRLFLLALAGEPQVPAMNLLTEERLDGLDNLCKWLLAAGYHLAGMDDAAGRILAVAGTEVRPERQLGGTFGSPTRDRAMLLYLAEILGRTETASRLAQLLQPVLAERSFLSTHECGYALLAVGRYLESRLKPDVQIRGKVTVTGVGFEKSFNRRGGATVVDLTEHTGREVTIHSDTSDPFYGVFEWRGIPVDGPTEAESTNLELTVSWRDEDGEEIDPTRLAQGTVFWGHLRVASPSRRHLENVALTQIVPSGWEIDATRLRGEAAPPWAQHFATGAATYTDIRDDRVMWFVDLHRRPLDFLVKLVAVTRGEFVLPPSVAETMYDSNYRALVPGARVEVVAPGGQR